MAAASSTPRPARRRVRWAGRCRGPPGPWLPVPCLTSAGPFRARIPVADTTPLISPMHYSPWRYAGAAQGLWAVGAGCRAADSAGAPEQTGSLFGRPGLAAECRAPLAVAALCGRPGAGCQCTRADRGLLVARGWLLSVARRVLWLPCVAGRARAASAPEQTGSLFGRPGLAAECRAPLAVAALCGRPGAGCQCTRAGRGPFWPPGSGC